MLQSNLEFEIVGEVADGNQTVEQAAALTPDLILLDIRLAGLNGIEAARQIKSVSPRSKIIFLSQEHSTEIVREALSTGACGYVVKAEAGSELLIAMESVLRGERFLSKRFIQCDLFPSMLSDHAR